MQQKEIAWCDGVPYVVIGRQIMQCCYGIRNKGRLAVQLMFVSSVYYYMHLQVSLYYAAHTLLSQTHTVEVNNVVFLPIIWHYVVRLSNM